MWLSKSETKISRRSAASLILCAFGSACGFTPTLSPGSSLYKLRDRVRVSEPDSTNDFTFRNALEEQIGTGQEFDLVYRITTSESDVGITSDQVVTRQQVDGKVTFTLSDRETGAELFSNSVSAFTSYGTTASTASTAFAREAAYERLMIILADRTINTLALATGLPA